MSVRRRIGLGLAAVTLAGTTLMVPATPAGATLTGPCTGSGTFVNGLKKGGGSFTVDANTTGVVTVPLKDTVRWQGSINEPEHDRLTDGYVRLDLPWPFGGVDIETWGKRKDGKDSFHVANQGIETYDLPSAIPRGVAMKVTGQHIDDAGTCSWDVTIQVEGSATDSVAVYPALAATVLAFGFAALSGKRRFKKVWVLHP